MKKMFAGAILLSLVPWNPMSSSVDAASENVCVDRARFIERLKQRYQERQVSNGINYNGVVVEVFTSEQGHFTILATTPDGISCLIATGDNWQETPILKTDVGI
jgi:hypothetical protein